MSIRAQREQIKKLSIKDRKLARLLFNKSVSDEDLYFLNYLYEERQSFTYFHCLGFPLFFAFGTNFTFFRMNSYGYQFMFTSGVALMGHLICSRMVTKRFQDRVNPYFEKYEIK